MVICFGDRLTWPVPVDVTGRKVLEVAAEGSILYRQKRTSHGEGSRVIETTQASGTNRNAPGRLDQLFRVRSRVIAAFAIVVPLIADLGDHRWIVVAGLALIALPYNMYLERQTSDRHEVPAYVPWVDQMLAISAVLIVAELWAAVLVVIVASLALSATVFEMRRLVWASLTSIVVVGLTGALTQDTLDAVVGTVGFAGAVALSVGPIALVTAHRHSLESENRDLVENIDAIVWSLVERRTHVPLDEPGGRRGSSAIPRSSSSTSPSGSNTSIPRTAPSSSRSDGGP